MICWRSGTSRFVLITILWRVRFVKGLEKCSLDNFDTWTSSSVFHRCRIHQRRTFRCNVMEWIYNDNHGLRGHSSIPTRPRWDIEIVKWQDNSVKPLDQRKRHRQHLHTSNYDIVPSLLRIITTTISQLIVSKETVEKKPSAHKRTHRNRPTVCPKRFEVLSTRSGRGDDRLVPHLWVQSGRRTGR